MVPTIKKVSKAPLRDLERQLVTMQANVTFISMSRQKIVQEAGISQEQVVMLVSREINVTTAQFLK
jgi:hypothetical protein